MKNPTCGRCGKEIVNEVYLVEAGYGPVHVLCWRFNVKQKT